MTRRFGYTPMLLGTILALLGWMTAPALAAAPSAGPPQWVITSVAAPAHLKPHSSENLYVVSATNVGGEATSGPITIEDSLPPEAEVTEVFWKTTKQFGIYGDAFTGNPLMSHSLEIAGKEKENSKVITALSSTRGISVGDEVSGTKIPAATTVALVKSSTELELSAPVEGAGKAEVAVTLTVEAGCDVPSPSSVKAASTTSSYGTAPCCQDSSDCRFVSSR